MITLYTGATPNGHRAAIMLEDQEFPKKCGHTPFKRLISTADMVDKVRVAVEARRDMLVIARTDARASEGLDGALARAKAYADAGADVLFVEALESEDEMRRACEALDQSCMANMSNGGLTPMKTAAELAGIGSAMAIFPAITSLAAATAMEAALIALKERGEGDPAELFDFKEFCGLIGFQDVWAFEKRWAR